MALKASLKRHRCEPFQHIVTAKQLEGADTN